MTKALWETKNLEVYIHDGKTPNSYNNGMLVCSKQPNSPYVFCIPPEELTVLVA